jgi:hypothetical protein
MAVLCLAATGCASAKMPAFLGGTRTAKADAPKVAPTTAPNVARTSAPKAADTAPALQGIDRQAEIAWRAGPGAAGYTLPTEYQRGWRDGYTDYLTYGNSGDPKFANRTRTSPSNDWLAGFRDGMTSAYTAVASEYPTLVAAAPLPFTPNAPPEVEYRTAIAAKDLAPPTIQENAPLPQPPTPPIERRVQMQPAAPKAFEPPPLPPKAGYQQQPLQAPPSAPRQPEPYTRMADKATMTSMPMAKPAGFSNPQGMPLPSGLKADEVSQSEIWATGQQPWGAQQPTIVRLPDTGEAPIAGSRY